MDSLNIQPAGIGQPAQGQDVNNVVSSANSQSVAKTANTKPETQVTEPSQPLAVPPMVTIPLPVNSSRPAVIDSRLDDIDLADDKDVIEPEWVQKAKTIVRTTSDDPYKQSEDLTLLKADYMKKRYNKVVKLK